MQSNELLVIVGFAVGLAALALAGRLTGRLRAGAPDLGWMSERWVAEQRATYQGRTD
jgi:hypothetical protein